MKKFIAMMLMLASVFFIACDNDDDGLSPVDTKAALEELNADMSGYFDEMQNAEGIKAMEAVLGMPDPFVDTKSAGRTSVLSNINKFLLPVNYENTKSVFEAQSFDFDTYVGTYTYKSEPFEYWEVIPGGDKIIINFPTEGSVTNDATITIYNYDEELIDYDYYPTDIDADLYVDGIKVVEVDLTADWNTNGEPESLAISVYLMPFTFSGTFSNIGTSASIDFEIDYEETLIFAAGLGATFATTSMEDAPTNMNGYIQILKVKIQANANVDNIIDIIEGVDDGTSTATDFNELINQINAEFDAYVTVDGTKAADIILVWDETAGTEGEPNIMFRFTDGSTEPALPYFEDFAADVEDFFYYLEDIYIGW
ncbi:MAG: hypothetical protein KOO66_09070 [Bacteroidales bacterium]|nr:hypothetical protein [Bacteroidales bacterium]